MLAPPKFDRAIASDTMANRLGFAKAVAKRSHKLKKICWAEWVLDDDAGHYEKTIQWVTHELVTDVLSLLELSWRRDIGEIPGLATFDLALWAAGAGELFWLQWVWDK